LTARGQNITEQGQALTLRQQQQEFNRPHEIDLGDRFAIVRRGDGALLGYRFKTPKYNYKEVEIEGGATEHVPVSEYGSAPFLSMPAPPTIKGKLPVKNRPISEDDLPNWVHKQTFGGPDSIQTPAELERAGFKRVSSETKKGIEALKSTENVLAEISALMAEVFPATGGATERIGGGIGRGLGALLQTHPKAAQLDSLIKGTLAPIIRALGEKGTLANQDVERAIKLLPGLLDSADVAWGKINQIKKIFAKGKASLMEGSAPSLNLESERRPGETPEQYLNRRGLK
jgi:hypothetical protein